MCTDLLRASGHGPARSDNLPSVFSALIIDADGKTPATLKSILAPYGFEFTVTENGPEAVNVARQAAPDIILLRAELPLTTGFSVCNRLRRNEDTRKIPLVLYSSNASDDVIEQHRNLKTHADQYLRLPVDADRLIAAVKPYLNLGEARAPAPTRSESKPEARAKPRLEVELSEASGSRPPPPLQPASQQFERDFGDEFGNLAGALQLDDDDSVPVKREPARPSSRSAVPEDSSVRRLSGPEMAADGDPNAFKAQREVLQLKSQLNTKNREILALKDELEARERTILDAKKHHRELQAQLGELETQLVASQEQILSSNEVAESAQRDKQTILKREEGLKTRLEVTQKKLKDTETQLASTQSQLAATQAQLASVEQQLAATQQTAAAAAAEASQQIAGHLATITDLQGERDGLAARVQQLTESSATLQDELAAAREDGARLAGQLELAQQDLADGLAAAREDRAAALAALAAQHQAELDDRDQEHRNALGALSAQLADISEQSQQEQGRLAQVLQETEDNARLQIAQLSAEIERLTQSLAAEQAHAQQEIERLQAAAAQAAEQAAEQAQADAEEHARKIRELETTLDDLSGGLDRAETALHRRREAALHAQQALAVALRVLDSANSDSDAP
jgi:CheY-like chemotaxis protein